jgi:hypothetical protein
VEEGEERGEPSMIPSTPTPSTPPESGLPGGEDPWLWSSCPSLVHPLLLLLQLELLLQVLA